MSEMSLNQTQLKEVLKAAILEVLQENREEFSELIAEALEYWVTTGDLRR
jgi:hypothetical protein